VDATRLDGVLFFPVTPFRGTDGAIAEDVLAEHVETGVRAGAGAVFAACGTGEFHALSPEEHALVVRTAVRATAGRVPVYVGAGGPVPVACAHAHTAQEAGADGLLLMPPYLVAAPQRGLVDYVAAVSAAADLPVIAYHRGNAVFDPQSVIEIAALPTVIGLKDGFGDLDLMTRIVTAVRSSDQIGEFAFFNGLPTAELTVPAYRGIGVMLYSSAVFCFAPEISLAFYDAVVKGDDMTVNRLLAGFYTPLVALRNTVPGYAVSLIKAAVRLGGLDVGGVRPPLVDPSSDHLARLADIVTAGRELVAA
jgi:5-dehydro-4-deoxyglucarate dehydratase